MILLSTGVRERLRKAFPIGSILAISQLGWQGEAERAVNYARQVRGWLLFVWRRLRRRRLRFYLYSGVQIPSEMEDTVPRTAKDCSQFTRIRSGARRQDTFIVCQNKVGCHRLFPGVCQRRAHMLLPAAKDGHVR